MIFVVESSLPKVRVWGWLRYLFINTFRGAKKYNPVIECLAKVRFWVWLRWGRIPGNLDPTTLQNEAWGRGAAWG